MSKVFTEDYKSILDIFYSEYCKKTPDLELIVECFENFNDEELRHVFYKDRNILHLASFVGLEGICQLVLENHDLTKDLINEKDTSQFTPLFCAVLKKNYNIIELLCNSEFIDINSTDRMMYTTLARACVKNDNRAIEILLKHRADPSIPNKFGKTTLHICAKNFNYIGIQLILTDETIDFNKKDISGLTAYDYLINYSTAESNMCKTLIENFIQKVKS
eukprot:TRINITY_DN13976_c0_g1_i1.p1 TRINITY_DN13976_c0_g1~~TRINITY_DN13976_c0_g1_i1.p1  ORF type:complete len:219 (-),score=43.26 TRINITY_DN13976_c0_g1_i1:333-989(-)